VAGQYPHKCPECGAPAYVGLKDVKCTAWACKHFDPASYEQRKLVIRSRADGTFELVEADAPPTVTLTYVGNNTIQPGTGIKITP
jgi:hypothetical protein